MKVSKAKLVAKLKALVDNAKKDAGASVVVGYTQRYALVVHENMNARHKSGKQAKYLEGPARQQSGEIARVVKTGYEKTKSLRQSLLLGGLRLQRESQKVVPIDTAALKASSFTAFEEDYENVATQAYEKSEAVRKAELERRSKKKIKVKKPKGKRKSKRKKKGK